MVKRFTGIILILAGMFLLATSWYLFSSVESNAVDLSTETSPSSKDTRVTLQEKVTAEPTTLPATSTAVVEAVSPVPTPVPATPIKASSRPQPTAVARMVTATPTRVSIPASTTETASTALPIPTSTKTPVSGESDGGEVALPKLLRFPSVGIEAAFEFVGLTPDGAMDVPKHPDRVAWFKFGPRPGQQGNAVVAGHVDWAGRVRAFWWLNRLEVGDVVEIVDQNDKSYSFVIQWKRVYDASTAPVQEILASSDAREITLITCGGVFDHQTKQYLSRLVVRAALQ